MSPLDSSSDLGVEPVAVKAFLASMPDAYREAFDDAAIEAHAAIVERRGTSRTRVEVWRTGEDGVVAICVVADDKPGLLSKITAALVAYDIDVVSAHAYGRKLPDGAEEAVDFLWIRRVPDEAGTSPPLGMRDIEGIGDMVDALAAGKASFIGPRSDESRPSSRSVHPAGHAPGSGARIRFERSEREGGTVLTVEASDRPGLLLVMTKTLFAAGVQIVGLRATTENGRAIDRFVLAEPGGRPLERDRMFDLQDAIFAALDEPTA